MAGYGLYVHIPYCETKCGYCDFFSVPLNDRSTSPLVNRILAELHERTNSVGGAPPRIRTVFVGGGTPTVLPPSCLGSLFEALGETVRSSGCEEFTVEANPATLDDHKLSILTTAGVDRISLGAQSWHGRELEALERLHAPDDIAPSVALARRHGIGRINLDLIFGISGQTFSSWAESLKKTIDLGVDHVSCYGLTYEPGTRLTAKLLSGRITPCEEGLEADMYLLAIETLAEHGYKQYEISNFARPGQRCLQNMIYWRNEPYIGVGPSAAGYVDGVRYKNVADIAAYIRMMDTDGHAMIESERVAGPALAGETMMMQLRLVDGIDVPAFIRQTRIDPHEAFRSSLAKYSSMGLVNVGPERIALSDRGRLVADAIIADLYAEVHAATSNRSDMHLKVLTPAP